MSSASSLIRLSPFSNKMIQVVSSSSSIFASSGWRDSYISLALDSSYSSSDARVSPFSSNTTPVPSSSVILPRCVIDLSRSITPSVSLPEFSNPIPSSGNNIIPSSS